MENAATPATPATSAAPAANKFSSLRPCLSRVGLVAFCVFVAALFLLAADQYWNLGFFPTKADREISALVHQLGDESLPSDQRLGIMNQVVDWNAFAVPVLLQAIQSSPARERDAAAQCLQEISLKYYNKDIASYGTDYIRLNKWWADLQVQWAKTSAEKKN